MHMYMHMWYSLLCCLLQGHLSLQNLHGNIAPGVVGGTRPSDPICRLTDESIGEGVVILKDSHVLESPDRENRLLRLSRLSKPEELDHVAIVGTLE